MAKPVDREISAPPQIEPTAPRNHPFDAEIEAERAGWEELLELIRSLDPAEVVQPGYYRDPDWSVRDVVGHLGTWLAEAQLQLQRLQAGTYEGHDIDVDALNATFLRAMHDQPWPVVWLQANSGRTRLLEEWRAMVVPSDEAAWWIRKSGGDHYAEHLGRLETWVAELVGRRDAPADEGTPA